MHSALLHELPETAVDALLVAAGPVSGSPQTLCELRRLGGAYASSGAPPSAFCHRDAEFNLAVIGRDTPQNGAHVAAHAQDVLTAISPWATGGVQPNFSAAAGPRAARRCYQLVRLSALGDRYDPSGVLAFGHAVRGF
jgi:hypothetical protein